MIGPRLVLIAMLACVVPTAAATDGYFDPAWPAGTGGGRTVYPGNPLAPTSSSGAYQILRENDGSLLVGGGVEVSYWWFGRLDPDGTPSLLYGESNGSGIATQCYLSGTTPPCFDWDFRRMALEPDGRVVVLDAYYLSRSTAQANAYDTSVFGGTGYVPVSYLQINQAKGYLSVPTSIARTPLGKWLVFGSGFYTQVSGNFDFIVAQLNSDFSLDTSFNSTSTDPAGFAGGQRVAFDLGGDKNEGAQNVLLQSEGRILLTGNANNGVSSFPIAAFARLKADGSVDSSFGSNGKYAWNWSAGTPEGIGLSSVRLDSADRIVFAQIAKRASDNAYGVTVTRLTADGSPDTTFGANSDAASFTPLPAQCTPSNYYPVVTLALDSAGRVLVAGGCSAFYVFRLRGDNGALDTTFGFGGYSNGLFDASATSSTATDVTFDASGQPVIAGSAVITKSKVGVARLTYDLVFTSNFEKAPRGCSPPDCN